MQVVATFTADPVLPVLGWWMDKLNLGLEPQLSPYAQVFQELLDPGSAMAGNQGGVNVVLLRLSDWAPENRAALTRDLAAAVGASAGRSGVPHIVIVCPSPEDVDAAGRAAQRTLLERLQAEADRALYERRALAVARESQISENELQSKLDLARKRADLVDQEGRNSRREAEEKAAADAIAVEAEARRIETLAKANEDDWKRVGGAKIANEAAYVRALAEAGPDVVRAFALKEMAHNMPSIGSVTITPDMLTDVLSAFAGSAKRGE